jgi:hypothetical protein
MLAETLAWLFTPASTTARRLGHLAESVAIAARYRRCRAAWAPHLAATRQALLDSARAAPGHRIALVLGSGHLLDVPLAELSELFKEVWLVDIVQPWSTRLAARRHDHVRLIETDVTECLADRPERPPVPGRFLDEAGIDWVASVNLLSQLDSPRLALPTGYGEALMVSHLAWLARFQAPVCLVSDIEQTRHDTYGAVIERRDLRPLLANWETVSEWRWDLAPPGELADGQSAWHRVAALSRQHEHQGDVEQAQAQVGANQDADAV